MRREVLPGAIGMTIAASFVFVSGSAGAGRSHDAGRGAGPGAARPTADYRGLSIPVPDGWPVYRLDREPTRCVRFDRQAIYLGPPGPEPDCPARLVGRTQSLHVAPLDPAADERGPEGRGPEGRGPEGREAQGSEVEGRETEKTSPAMTGPGSLAGYRVPDTAEGEVRLRLPAAGVELTGSFGSEQAVLRELLRGIRIRAHPAVPPPAPPGSPTPARSREGTAAAATPPRPRAGLAAPAGRHAPRRPAQRAWVVGRGFDTCTAPSIEAMRAWSGVYRVANIYIGGASRGCAQPNLTSAWVRAVRAMGYRLIPTYVGLQAPCTAYETRFHRKNAAIEGRRAATGAIRQARALGIPRRKPIYFDLEAYDSSRTKCRNTVLRFMHSWSKRMRAKRYTSGVYSSVASGIVDIGRATGIVKPKTIWFAHWDGKAQVHGSPYLPDTWWTPHRRIKQYRGGHRETHNGVTINIDSNIVDGRVF